MVFSKEQNAWTVIWYGRSGSPKKVQIEFRKKFGRKKRPPYSPDLTPCDFFLWGWIKSRVYRTQTRDLDDLQARIQHAFDELPQEMINRAIDSYER